MGKKKGKAVKAELPKAPTRAEEPDDGDPGQVSEASQASLERRQVSPSSSVVGQPPASSEADGEQATEKLEDIRIKLVDKEGNAAPHEAVEVKLPNGEVIHDRLDEKGRLCIEGIPKGKCEIRFPDLDEGDWTKAG